jgi:hypothetical protein
MSGDVAVRLRAVVALALLSGALTLAWTLSTGREPEREQSASGTPGGDENRFDVDWSAVRRVVGSKSAVSDLRAISDAMVTPSAASYVLGIRRLESGEVWEALAAFEQIPAEEIPIDLAYAPYRLGMELRPGQESAHSVRLLAAIDERQLPRLTAARVLAHSGRLSESLVAYAATDALRWTGHDLECFALLWQHGALRSDVRSLIWRGLARRGTDDSLSQEFRALTTRGDTTQLEENFRRRLEADAGVRELARISIDRMREVRSLFLQRRYADLLSLFGDFDPDRATTEMSALLFLAALRQHDASYTFRWGQELKRRHPEQEMAEWVTRLTGLLERR